MLRIGEFSKLSRITVKTLRYYDKIGLLKPAMIDSATQYRYYSEEQLKAVRTISIYKDAGLSNEMIADLLRGRGDKRALLAYQRQVLAARAEELGRAMAALDRLLCEGERVTYEAQVRRVEARLVFCCRGYVASAESIHDFIKCSTAELKKTNPAVGFSEPDYCCVIYPGDGYRESGIFIEYAQSVDRVGRETEIIKFKQIEPITAVCVTHRGKYEDLRDAYLFAVSWAKEHGYVLDGEPRERYIHGAWDRKDEKEWVTELQLPVREK